MFGLYCIFLDEHAGEKYPHLIEAGRAEILTDMTFLRSRLTNIPRVRPRDDPPDTSRVISKLDVLADEYRCLCRGNLPAREAAD